MVDRYVHRLKALLLKDPQRLVLVLPEVHLKMNYKQN